MRLQRSVFIKTVKKSTEFAKRNKPEQQKQTIRLQKIIE